LRRQRSQHDWENEEGADEEFTDDEATAQDDEELSSANLSASYQQARAEAHQVKEELLQAVWSSQSIAPAVQPEMYAWIQGLDPESARTSEVVDEWIRQWESYFPVYDGFLSLLRQFSSASFRTSSYKWLSQNFGS
jgi:hypothetical protein